VGLDSWDIHRLFRLFNLECKFFVAFLELLYLLPSDIFDGVCFFIKFIFKSWDFVKDKIEIGKVILESVELPKGSVKVLVKSGNRVTGVGFKVLKLFFELRDLLVGFWGLGYLVDKVIEAEVEAIL
jgi:hypothetical protein